MKINNLEAAIALSVDQLANWLVEAYSTLGSKYSLDTCTFLNDAYSMHRRNHDDELLKKLGDAATNAFSSILMECGPDDETVYKQFMFLVESLPCHRPQAINIVPLLGVLLERYSSGERQNEDASIRTLLAIGSKMSNVGLDEFESSGWLIETISKHKNEMPVPVWMAMIYTVGKKALKVLSDALEIVRESGATTRFFAFGVARCIRDELFTLEEVEVVADKEFIKEIKEGLEFLDGKE